MKYHNDKNPPRWSSVSGSADEKDEYLRLRGGTIPASHLSSVDREVTDEEIRQRILSRRKNQLKKRRRKRLRRRILLVVIIVLVAANAVYWSKYYNNLMIAGGDILDGDAAIVQTAKGELGNYGGEKYWRWYGFDYQVDWCACFVSWCADQNGMIDDGTVPMSCYVPEEVNWFQNKDMWEEGGSSYEPKSGDIIFFDWEHDGDVDHVGIVAAYYKGRVFTIEGNSGYRDHEDDDDWEGDCRRNGYDIDSEDIYGYGLTTRSTGEEPDTE